MERARRGSASSGRGSDRTLSRIAVPVMVGLAIGLVVAVICYSFLPSAPRTVVRDAPSPSAPGPASMDGPMSADSSTAEDYAPPVTEAPVQGAESAPIGMAGELDAANALERFLNAPSLRGRVGMIEPSLPADELENSILASPLPRVGSMSATTPFHDKLTGLTVQPFRVTFRDPTETPAEFIVHVRTRRGGEPKIAVEPFLDLVGGRLAEFAASPVAGQETFHAIIEGIPRCFEDGIPNPDRKFTYRLSASDSGQEIARAYASLNSRLAEDLYSQSSRIRWGVRKEATVVLSWNFKEDPERPFLQLDTIISPDWNP